MNLRYDLIRPEWLEIMAEILTFGSDKHKSSDFSNKTQEEYFRSAMGHIVADRKGIFIDNDDSMPTIVKAAVNLLIIYTKRCGVEKTINGNPQEKI